MLSYFFARGYLRQEKNMLVSIPRDVVLKTDSEMQALIGSEASGKTSPWIEDSQADETCRVSLWVCGFQEVNEY